VTLRTVYNCRRRWRLFGLKGLAPAAHPGRPPRVTAAYLKLLMQMVEKDPRQLGFACSHWTRARLATYLQECTQVRLSARTALEAASPYVRTSRLPKYTSETLNWIESVWDHLTETYFSRMLTEQREAFYSDAVRFLRRLRRSGRLGPLALRATP
jgi:hypothetical protein